MTEPTTPMTEPTAQPPRIVSRPFGPDFLTHLFHHPLDPGYSDAAARRHRSGVRTGWRARTTQAVSLLTLVTIGFLLVVAYRRTVAEEPERSRARAGLVAEVREREGATDGLQRGVDALRETVARQRDAALSGADAARLRDLEGRTGLARVRGNGIVVRTTDAPPDVDAVTGARRDLGRVLDTDLQKITNALWAAGAEAISINGQRLTTTSAIRTAGTTILVDFRQVTGPYEVSAIGPGTMEEAFKRSGTGQLLRQLSREEGLGFAVRRAPNLTLPAADEPQLLYARPATSATASAAPGPGTPRPSPSKGGR